MKKTVTRKFGRDGRHDGIIKKEVTSFGSSSDSREIQQILKDWLSAGETTLELLPTYEQMAVKIIEDYGYEVNKPYQFQDSYKIDKKSTGTLSGLVEKRMNSESWALEPLGRAANILTQCHILRNAMNAGHIENTAHHAMLLQQQLSSLAFSNWEYPARVGEKQLVAKNVSYSSADRATWMALYNGLKIKYPGISKRKAAEKIERETGQDSESIRKYI